MKAITEKELKEMIEKQMKINGYNDIKFEDLIEMSKKGKKWYWTYTTTPEKEEEFKKWLDNYFKKNLKMQKKKLREETIGWFILKYGLKAITEKE